jgi:hypothetical protein
MVILRNDGTLLSKASIAELLKPQVKDNEYLADERNTQIFAQMWPRGGKVKVQPQFKRTGGYGGLECGA